MPVFVLCISLAAAVSIIVARPRMESAPPLPAPPVVQVVTARQETVRLNVRSQGVVAARTEIDLVTEVSGKIVRIHPAFAAGGFLREGEELVLVDPRDYDNAVVKAEARVAEAKRGLLQEEAAVTQAEGEWTVLGEGEPTPLALHQPQLAEARARLKAAQADLADARLKRLRCAIRAPFTGRVRDKRIGIGQFLNAGEKLGRIYSVDAVEIRLPISPDQALYLDLPNDRLGGEGGAAEPAVTLTAGSGADSRQWTARIVRTEGNLDEASGLLYLVAEVLQPYAPGDARPPLRVGTFVQAEIEGGELAGIFVLPQGALNASQEALLVDGADRLHLKRLDVLRSEADRVLVRGGLSPGDRVVVSGVEMPVEGMKVTIGTGDPPLGAVKCRDGCEMSGAELGGGSTP
ncbi:MAG: efflux RND transporter periplasmic adaptor subunit [Pseudomonadota bacterium]